MWSTTQIGTHHYLGNQQTCRIHEYVTLSTHDRAEAIVVTRTIALFVQRSALAMVPTLEVASA
jgi:hypothetical protein